MHGRGAGAWVRSWEHPGGVRELRGFTNLSLVFGSFYIILFYFLLRHIFYGLFIYFSYFFLSLSRYLAKLSINILGYQWDY